MQDTWDHLSLEFINIWNKHVPWKIIKVKGRHLPWVDSHLISLFRQQDLASAKFRKTKDPLHWDVYRQLRNTSKNKTKNAKAVYYADSFFKHLKNPRQFWRKANYLLNKSNQSIDQVKFKDQFKAHHSRPFRCC